MGRICPDCGRPIRRGEKHVCPARATQPADERRRRTRDQELERDRSEHWRKHYRSKEFRHNRLVAIARTHGCDAITGEPLYEHHRGGWVPIPGKHGEVHHRVPLSQGGTDKVDNLMLVSQATHERLEKLSRDARR